MRTNPTAKASADRNHLELMYELQEFFHHPLYGDDEEEDIEKMLKILNP